jgi:nitroreductase
MAEIGLFEAIYSARSLRRLKPDPVPDEVITKVLDAAIRAPSGSNSQNWFFIVIKDAARRKKIADIYRRGGGLLTTLYQNRERPAHMTEKQQNRLMASAMYLFEHMDEVPVILIAGLRAVPMPAPSGAIPPEVMAGMKNMARTSGSSIYPAVQNIILACRANGLGTVLTTIHLFFEDEVREILGLPADAQTYALMPIGYPKDKFGPLNRIPVNQVACLDHWGQPWKGAL